ncbi:hypothetical protein ERICIV_01329 [Paenibacillus larvae subsp. larvae]|uniref:Uncharacterized protein n=3 Tax=Paenibacillus larvae TaxID=1464 RepID=A0A2L1UBI6_9BACL|nr:hypothetical protein [Paenibacillus larvae]AQT86035.1 hypothetical protein B1222_19035 [Paenibacillus larvae subsp. pulvifaciens]AQZ45719.1 hypothetical protein B5S25_02990 [Paenibacillus larvae subsp. pulvifaciens]AVF25504.1 hypothetical protein ERICIII_01308 [Paenibacillus larvae subsp. larvae]AVF30281.1 hypothetical protein ERICIV_01329 [Paenibacillus larvae subsp. larvae]MBH0340798.1 hypothetical protein [Paenibacillus larvae]
MNALFWKSLQAMKHRKPRLAVLFILPIIYLYALYRSGLSQETILVFFPATFTLFSSVIHFSMEDIIGSESILATSISIQKIWLWNLIFIVASGYVYSIILLTAGTGLLNLVKGIGDFSLSVYDEMQFIANLALCFAFLGAATCHYADYSFGKQMTASVFALIHLACPFVFLIWGSRLEVNQNSVWITLATAVFIFLIAFIFIRNSNKEKLLMNTQKLIMAYNNTNNTIEE